MIRQAILGLALAAALGGAAVPASGDIPVFKLAIRGRRFVPEELAVPQGQKIKLVVSNENDEPSEFESFSLHREQVVPGHSQATLFLGPLREGSYNFFDDFHPEVRGAIRAVAPAGER